MGFKKFLEPYLCLAMVHLICLHQNLIDERCGGFHLQHLCTQPNLRWIIDAIYVHSTTHTLQSSDRQKIREFLFVQTEERERDTPMPEVLVPGYCQQSTHNSNEQWWGSASVKHRVCVQNHFNMTHRGCRVTPLLLPFREKCQAGIWLPNL